MKLAGGWCRLCDGSFLYPEGREDHHHHIGHWTGFAAKGIFRTTSGEWIVYARYKSWEWQDNPDFSSPVQWSIRAYCGLHPVFSLSADQPNFRNPWMKYPVPVPSWVLVSTDNAMEDLV